MLPVNSSCSWHTWVDHQDSYLREWRVEGGKCSILDLIDLLSDLISAKEMFLILTSVIFREGYMLSFVVVGRIGGEENTRSTRAGRGNASAPLGQ